MTTETKISMNDKKKNGSKQDHLQFLFHRGGKTAISPPSFAGHGHGGRGTAELAGFCWQKSAWNWGSSPGFEYKISSLWNSHLRLDSSSGGFCCQLVLSAWDETTHTSYKYISHILLAWCTKCGTLESYMDTQNYHIYFIHISSFFSCISDIFPSDLDFETNLSAAAFPAGKNVACLKIDSASTDRVFRPPDLKPGEVRPRRHRPRLLREKNRCIEKTIFE